MEKLDNVKEEIRSLDADVKNGKVTDANDLLTEIEKWS